MSEVEKFRADLCVRPIMAVAASDYDALAAECERVRAANIDCVDHFNQAMADLLELTAERDAALAELAALKGGQGVAQYQYLSRGETARWWNIDESDVAQAKVEGFEVRELFTAPPAQASAWVPEGWKLVPVVITDVMAEEFGAEGTPRLTPYDQAQSIWDSVLAAAPTPGASDGKGGAN